MTERMGNRNLKASKGERVGKDAVGRWGGCSWCAGEKGVGEGGRRAENLEPKGPFTGIHKCVMP